MALTPNEACTDRVRTTDFTPTFGFENRAIAHFYLGFEENEPVKSGLVAKKSGFLPTFER